MKPSESLALSRSEFPKLYRLRLFKYSYIILSFVCIGWLFADLSWEPIALTVLALLGLGALGPQFAKLPQGTVSDFEIGATACGIPDPTISQSWLAMIFDSLVGAAGLAFYGFAQLLAEGFIYLIIGGVFFLFSWLPNFL